MWDRDNGASGHEFTLSCSGRQMRGRTHCPRVIKVNEGYFSAFAVLAGSLLGTLGSIGTTFLSLRAQDRARRLGQAATRREALYGQFIEEASKLVTDALTHKLEDWSKLVPLYAVINKLRLFAPPNVVKLADEVMLHIFAIYGDTSKDFHIPQSEEDGRSMDILRSFSEACRKDISW